MYLHLSSAKFLLAGDVKICPSSQNPTNENSVYPKLNSPPLPVQTCFFSSISCLSKGPHYLSTYQKTLHHLLVFLDKMNL